MSLNFMILTRVVVLRWFWDLALWHTISELPPVGKGMCPQSLQIHVQFHADSFSENWGYLM